MSIAEREGNGHAGPPAAGGVGLLLIDFINDMAFEGAEAMRTAVMAAARVVASLRQRADELGVPVVYVNDNYGQWHSERSRIIDYCTRATPAGRELAQIIAPRENDYFIIKPRFSGFYATNLPVLLPKLGVQRLVMTGIAVDICVLFTAADAHMRAYDLWVPADGVAGERKDHTEWALQIMARSMQAETRPTSALRLDTWLQLPDRPARTP